jgi:hypothetical protein
MVVTQIDYVVSGVWFTRKPFRHLTHVLIHKDKVTEGEKISVEEVARLLDEGKIIYSAYHHKKHNRFFIGDKIDFAMMSNFPYVYIENRYFFEYLKKSNDFNPIAFVEGNVAISSFTRK